MSNCNSDDSKPSSDEQGRNDNDQRQDGKPQQNIRAANCFVETTHMISKRIHPGIDRQKPLEQWDQPRSTGPDRWARQSIPHSVQMLKTRVGVHSVDPGWLKTLEKLPHPLPIDYQLTTFLEADRRVYKCSMEPNQRFCQRSHSQYCP